MKIYSYIVKRDYGFAPNPFYGYCTLATCKPVIRKHAEIGDIIVGIGSGGKNSVYKNRMIFAMKISEVLTYDQYWNDIRFQKKKPIMSGSKNRCMEIIFIIRHLQLAKLFKNIATIVILTGERIF